MTKLMLSLRLILTVILQIVVPILGHENLCPIPTDFPNSKVEWSDRTLGAYATYSCREGYEMTGPAETVVAYCDENGSWRSSIRPECIVVQCQLPVVPAYGNVTYLTGRGEYGSVVLYQCDRYYRRFGTASAQCLSDGTWSKTPPVCKIHCNTPVLPNGTVSHLNDHVCLEFSDDLLDWRTAQARCQDDSGSLVIIRDDEAQETISMTLADIIDVDGSDRFWIGAEERRSSVVQETRNWQWVDGTLVDDVFWGPGEPTSATDSPSRGECVDLDSAMDFEWNDNNCSIDQRYICQFGESGICGDPGEPLHGSRTLLACDENDDGLFVEGCLITFSCDPGFRLVGESSSTCESTGRWSEELPTCERKLCSTRPTSENLEETLSNSYRGVAVYRCPTGSYAVEGDAFAFCRQNGVWSTPNLLCETSITISVTSQPSLDPDWTFIGIVGALGILLLIAILIIIILAAVRNKNLNSRRKNIRPLPHASASSRKRRSTENTYYSIRKPIPSPPAERSGQEVELRQMRRLSDVGESTTAVAQQSLTYDKSDALVTDSDYLEPIKVLHPESLKIPPRLPSGEYVDPLSPRSGTYDEIDDDVMADDETVEDDDGLLNNYIILLPDDEDKVEKKVDVAVSEENETVIEKEVDTKGDEEEEKSTTDNVMGGETEPTERTTESATLPINGLQVPLLTLPKEGFGSTVEL
ncbi:CUB and sushi domain-containing protein 1 [Strongylocentrotus purpuratus]|uniref:Uncharacterized protein n=1 Tax=Strongylocentrotus purpuratus TaxID=7668 RepID=A0A7M7GRK0_STRPU|nr:CUB and sushi domain-containing protein 1 [Strongylocentrotus purpuratus]